jgi:CheY-like chemotaxis protein
VRTASFLALALALALAGSDRAAAQPKGKQLTPVEQYAKFRDTMNEGKFDIAGIYLDQFLKMDPPDSDLLKLQEKYGSTVFQQLRTVPRYSDDPANEKVIRANVEKLNARAEAAAKKVLNDPARVEKYVRNLGATYEEKVFAQQELKRTGEFAVPYLVQALQQNPGPALYAGVLETIPVLDAPSMSGWVAALEQLDTDRQFGVLTALGARRDVFALITDAQTDFGPQLWRIASRDPKDVPPNLRALALTLLNRLYPGTKPDDKRPEAELLAHAQRFYNRRAKYSGTKTNPDGTATVPLWTATTEGKVLKLSKISDVPVGKAEEYYGLKYARWALESKPDYEPARALILSLAAERATERAQFAPLATAEPVVYKLLSGAPSETLNDLMHRGLNEKRTSLVLAMTQLLGDRADRAAATPPAGTGNKPSLLVRALAYPDHSVQFAAATALLRSPVPVPPAARQNVVDVLRRALAADPGAPAEAKGTALLADPVKFRADNTAAHLRGLGFNVEQYTSGRELMKRIARASDFDVVVLDRHTANPELIDTVAALQSDPRAAARPLFVVASSDKPRVPTFDQLLLRTAALIAATENDVVEMPPPFVPDPRLGPDENAVNRKKIQERRDNSFRAAAAIRTERLQRVIDALPLTLNDDQKRLMNARIQLVVYSLLAAEFPLSQVSAPETFEELQRVRKLIALQPVTAAYGAGIPSADLMKLIDRFELDVAKVKAARDRYDTLRGRVDPAELGLNVESFRDRTIEARLVKSFTGYPDVKVIAEPYSRLVLESEFSATFADPMMLPRSPAVKQADARTALEWLRRMAIGEVPGYDLTSTEADLRAALRVPVLAPAAIDALERFKGGEAQIALLQYALGGEGNPLEQRARAADAVIWHVRAFGSAIPATLQAPLSAQAESEPNADLRGKFLALKGIVANKPAEFVDLLKGYSPPLVPPAAPKKDAEPKKEADPKP